MASSLQLVPSDGADAATTFRQLGVNFSIAEAVTDALVKARLEEFRYFFESEDKVQPWLSKLSLGEDANLQGARVRRAWAAVSLYFKQSEQDRSRISASDLDALLGDSELRDLKSTFFGAATSCGSPLRFTLLMQRFLGSHENSRNACCVCTTFGE